MFNNFNLKPELLSALDELGFTTPTPVQAEVLPLVLEGQDCIAKAPTGTGKTLAFGLPALNAADPENSAIQTLIICPTRELAMQIDAELKRAVKYLEGIRIMSVYGGQPIQRQLAQLRKRPQIVVGTPGRILDHIRRKTIRLDGLKMLVLDEADEMLNMGFRDDIDDVLKSVKSASHQTLLFSATISKEIAAISKNYQKNPVSVELKYADEEIPNITQYYTCVKDSKKLDAFLAIYNEHQYGVAMIFCNTKKRVDELNAKLLHHNIPCDCLHGDMRQKARDTVMKKFRGSLINVLIATDVAARGIDVKNIQAVFNFDIPRDDEYYIHRIGRTARANMDGVAYNFVTEKEFNKIKTYERITKQTMQELKVGGVSQDKPTPKAPRAVKPAAVDSVRLFMNIGEKDKLNDKDIENFVMSRADIFPEDIFDLNVLELFSFIEVPRTKLGDMLALNDCKFSGRTLVVEPCDGRKPASKGKRNDNSRNNKPRRDGERSFSNSSSERKPRRDGEKSFSNSSSDRKPRRDSERSFDHSSSDRKPRRDSERSFDHSSSDRKPRRDGEKSFSNSSSDRKPRRDSERSFDHSSSDRKPRRDGERSFSNSSSERKPRRDSERNFDHSSSDRKPRRDGEKSFSNSSSDRKPRRDGERSFDHSSSDRKPRRDGEKSFSNSSSDRKPRRDSERSFSTPKESFANKSEHRNGASSRPKSRNKSFGNQKPNRSR